MKHWKLAVALICFGSPAFAQDAAAPVAPVIAPAAPAGALTLGGVPQLIANKIAEAKAAGIVDLAGHIGAGGYVPTWTFHDKNGVNYVETAGIGYRAIQGQKPSVLLVPFVPDLTAISGRLWDFQWAHDHVTRSPYPDLFIGPTVLLPVDGPQIRALKLKDPKPWLGFLASVRFK